MTVGISFAYTQIEIKYFLLKTLLSVSALDFVNIR